MSLVRRGDVWHYDFILDGKRFQGTTKHRDRDLAQRVHDDVRSTEILNQQGRIKVQELLKRRRRPDGPSRSRRQGRIPDGPGWIYLVRIIGGPVKIGATTREDPRMRTAHVESHVPYPTEVLGFMRCDEAAETERKFHLLFADKRRKGEWFNLTQDDIDSIFREFPFISRLEPTFEQLKVVMQRCEAYCKKLRGEE